MAVNGSTTDGGCPASCLGVESTLSTCNCPLHAGLPANATAGVLLDDVVPILNVSAGNGSVWAAPLLTLEGSGSTTKLMVQFKTRVSLVEIELYLFYCRSWGIGTGSILVYQFETFPNFTRTMSSLGSVTLTGEMEDCESVIRVTIPLMEANSTAYVLEFRNPSGDPIMWVHIAEARFSDVATTVPGKEPIMGFLATFYNGIVRICLRSALVLTKFNFSWINTIANFIAFIHKPL